MQDLKRMSAEHPALMGAHSAAGPRAINEDAVYVDAARGLLVVADGCGGPGKGDVASAMIVECVASLPPGPDALSAANTRVFEAAQVDSALKGMGATVVLAVVESDRAQIYHAGEARAYLVRGGTIQQLTEDHTLASQLVKTKQITPEAAATHPARKAILRYVGKGSTLQLDHQEVPLEPRDILLLCTDGFYASFALESLLALAEQSPDQASLETWLGEAMSMVAGTADDNLSAAVYCVPASGSREDNFYQRFIEQSIDSKDLDAALRSVLKQMVHASKADRAFITLFDGDGQPAHAIVWNQEGDPQVLFPHCRTVVQQLMARKETIWVTDAKSDPRMAASKSIVALDVGTVVAFPLLLGSQLVGMIYLDRRTISQYTPKEVKELEGLTVCAKFAVANNQSHEDFAHRLQKFQIINDVSLAINATIKLEHLLSLIIHHSLALSGGDQGYILLGSDGNLECLASHSATGEPIQELQISRSIVNRCLEENRSICILDTQDGDEFQTKSVMAFDLRSVMCIPLSANQERVGVLYISSNAITKTFSAHDQALLESIAVQAALTIRNAQLLREQERQILQLEEALEKYRKAEHEASTDMLTGLHNRRYFEDQSARHIALCKRHNRALSVIMLDVDHFKKFNDTYGHAVGDEVLKVMGSVLPQSVRVSDIAARFGGEEFVVLCPDTDAPGAQAVAERIRRAIAEVQLLDAEGKPVRQITASLGVAALQVSDEDIATIMERADTALYACKANGRNQSQIWQPEMLSPEALKNTEHVGI